MRDETDEPFGLDSSFIPHPSSFRDVRFMRMIRFTPFRQQKGYAAAVLFLIGFLSGCGNDIHPVEGKVVWKGGALAKELEGSHVVFELPEKKTSARGIIQADGTFRLSTHKPNDGAPSGEHKVLILEDRKNANAEGTLLAPALLDPRFADLKTSGLTASVKPGANAITLTVERAPSR
jgi:hypothetical protein